MQRHFQCAFESAGYSSSGSSKASSIILLATSLESGFPIWIKAQSMPA
jgi:hypothetical protein